MSRADDNNDLDALFSTEESTDVGDLFSSLNGDSSIDGGSAAFDFDKGDSGIGGFDSGVSGFDFSKSDDLITGLDESGAGFGESVAESASVEAESADAASATALTKKSKKGKKERVKKEKKPKAEKSAKGEKEASERYGSPFPFFVLGAFFLLIILAGNIAAFASAGAGAIGFLIYFDLLGLVLLSVPAMLLWQQTKQRVGLFDVALALVVACLALGCMAILAFQAKTYGGSSKVASVVAQTVDRA